MMIVRDQVMMVMILRRVITLMVPGAKLKDVT